MLCQFYLFCDSAATPNTFSLYHEKSSQAAQNCLENRVQRYVPLVKSHVTKSVRTYSTYLRPHRTFSVLSLSLSTLSAFQTYTNPCGTNRRRGTEAYKFMYSHSVWVYVQTYTNAVRNMTLNYVIMRACVCLIGQCGHLCLSPSLHLPISLCSVYLSVCLSTSVYLSV